MSFSLYYCKCLTAFHALKYYYIFKWIIELIYCNHIVLVISFTLKYVIKFSRSYMCKNLQQTSWQGWITAKLLFIKSKLQVKECQWNGLIQYEDPVWMKSSKKVSLLWFSSGNKIVILPKWKFMLYQRQAFSLLLQSPLVTAEANEDLSGLQGAFIYSQNCYGHLGQCGIKGQGYGAVATSL